MRLPVVLVLLALLAAPAHADTGVSFERRVERIVASPTPLGPLLLAGDSAEWRVLVPAEAYVQILALGTPGSPFLLRAQREGAAESSFVAPTSAAGFALSTPGAWRVAIDPLGGVAVDIRVRFDGYVVNESGARAAFTLEDVERGPECVVPGVCLA